MTDTIIGFEGVGSGVSLSTTNEPLVGPSISAGTGGSIKGQPTAALNGTMGLEMICGTTAGCIFDVPLTAGAQQRLHLPIKLPTTFPAGAANPTTIWQFYGDNGAGGTQIVLRLQLSLAGAAWNLTVTDLASAHANLAVPNIPDLAPYAGQYVAFGVLLDSKTLATNGDLKVRFYPNPYSTTLGGTEGNLTNLSLGAGNSFLTMRVGFNTTQVATHTIQTDYIRHGNASTTYYGAVPAASVPVGVVTGDYLVERSSPAHLDSSTSTGTITSRTWTAVHNDGAAVTNSAPTGVSTDITSAFPGQIAVTMTPFNGTTAGTPVVWTVYNRVKPGEDVDVYSIDTTPFSNAGTSPVPDMKGALNDESLGSWAQSSDTPAGEILGFWLYPIGDGAIYLQPIDRSMGGTLGTGVTMTLFISKGGTQVYQFSYVPTPTTFTEKVQAVDGPGLAIANTLDKRKMMYVTVSPTA